MDILYYDKCAQFALKQRGMAGTTLEGSGLRVYKRYDFNPQAIYSAVGKGGIVMPIVSGEFFGTPDNVLVYTVITMVNNASRRIELFNPVTEATEVHQLGEFLDRWIIDGSDCITAFSVDEKTYRPVVADLSNITLPDDLKALGELLAANAHNVWALERQSEGWTYGPKRDDGKLQTPDMIPYTELPETEKEYDRKMATGTLKWLIAMGYKIVNTNK